MDGDGVDAILAVLQLHPAFLPGYARTGVELRSADRGRFWIEPCDALEEGDPYGWLALLGIDAHPALDAMVQAVDPRARCVPATPSGAARFAWDVVRDRAAKPAPPPPEAAAVRASLAARFAFAAR